MIKKKLLRALAIVTMGILIFGGYYYVAEVRPLLYTGTGLISKAMCSGVFVSGLTPEKVFDEEIKGQSPILEGIPWEVDTDNQLVTAATFGVSSTSIFHTDTGCTIYQSEIPSKDADTMLNRGAFKTLEPSNNVLASVETVIDKAFEVVGTRAVLVWHNGKLLSQRYAEGISVTTPLKGWSMNKTITGLIIGLLVDKGWLDLDAPAPVAAWHQTDGDPRAKITLRDLLQMNSGLQFKEDYVDVGSDVVRMLFSSPSAAAVAAGVPLDHEPGTYFSYSSGTSNIVAKIAIDTITQQGYNWLSFVEDNLFQPLGITTAYLETDASGFYVGSSYGYMAAQDWAKLGILMANKGKLANGRTVISERWIDFLMRDNITSNGEYSAHYWLYHNNPAVPPTLGSMSGFRGQFVLTMPDKNLVIVRLGETPSSSFEDVALPLVTDTLQALNLNNL